MRCVTSLTMDSHNVRAVPASLLQHLILSPVPLPPTFIPTGQSAAAPNVLIQPSVGLRTPFAPSSSSPSFGHPAFRSSAESPSPIIPPSISYVPGSYIPPPGPPTMHAPPSGIPPPPSTFHGPENILIVPAVAPGPSQGQPPTFPSQSAPRGRSRSRTPDGMVRAPQTSRRAPTVFAPDGSRGRYPSRRRGARDESVSRSRSYSPTERGSRSRSRLRRRGSERRRRSVSPIIITQPRLESESRSPRRRERPRYPPFVPPGGVDPMIVHMSRSPSGSPRGAVYDDRTQEPRRRRHSRDRHRRRLFKPRQRSRSRDRTPPPVIFAPSGPVVPGQALGPQVPLLPPPGTAVPVMVQQPPSAAYGPPPSSRSRRHRGDPHVVVLPPDYPPERYRDRDRDRDRYRDRYRHPDDDRYDGRYGRRRGSPRGYPYRPYPPSARDRSSRPRSRSPWDRPRTRHHSYSPRSRSRRYSPSFSSYDSRSRSPSPRGHLPYSGGPRSSRGYPRSSRRLPSRYPPGDHDPSVFAPGSRLHYGSSSPPIVLPSPLGAPSGSHRPPTLLPPSRGRSPSRSFVTVDPGTAREEPPIFIGDTQHPATHASSIHVPLVSQSTLRSYLN